MEKIQELTEKLYREGVERGQAEAAKIKAEAEAEAQKILDNAREQAANSSWHQYLHVNGFQNLCHPIYSCRIFYHYKVPQQIHGYGRAKPSYGTYKVYHLQCLHPFCSQFLHHLSALQTAFSIIRILFTPCISISSAKLIPIL